MSEGGLKDPVRIVYHAENRTFARLFHERSLKDLKDVVRRKMDLGQDADVSLKQMGANALLDLDDDDDFQAFCVLLKSVTSVDIQVTVSRSEGSPMPPPAAVVASEDPLPEVVEDVASRAGGQQPFGELPSSVFATTTISTPLPSKQPAQTPSVPPARSNRTTDISATAVKTPEHSARKRRVSFDDAALTTSKKTAAVTPVVSAVCAETPGSPKPAGVEEPPKKKRKKVTATAKDAEITPGVESPVVKVTATPKTKSKKSAALSLGNEAGPSASKDAETPRQSVKKSRKVKKDGSTVSKKSTAPVDQDGTSQPVDPLNDSVNELSVQSASEKSEKATVESRVLKTRKSEKIKPPTITAIACAAIPQTNASTSVQCEVAAAIISGLLSNRSMTVPPPPAKKKSMKRVSKKSSTSSSTLPAESTAVSNVPANEVSNLPTDPALPINGPPQQSNGPPCPICLEEPFHIRYCCPIVSKGPDAIRERLQGLQKTNMVEQQQLIKELKGLLRDSAAPPMSSLNAAPPNGIRSQEVSRQYNIPLPGTPAIPSNSCVSEVTMEDRDEGSSSESSDDMSKGVMEHKDMLASRRQPTPDEQRQPINGDLEAIIRGPVSKQQSILDVIDRIVGDQDDGGSESDTEEVVAELEEDSDEEVDRLRRRLARRITHSSDSESEDDEPRSPSHLAEGVSNTPEHSLQNSDKPAKGSAERQSDDVVMSNSIDPPVREGQDGDSSEETHVESEDRMVVDHGSIGEKAMGAITEQQVSSPAPGTTVLPLDMVRDEPQESEIDPASTVLVVSNLPNETEADPIESAEDLEPPIIPSSNADPIEVHSEDVGSLFSGAAQSTPKPGLTKRIKTRHGQILGDEADHPVLLEQLGLEAIDVVTPLPTRGKSGRKVLESSASQEPTFTRRSPRFSSLPPSTSTPAAVVLLSHRAKIGARTGKSAKTPAKQPEENLAALQAAQDGTRILPTPARWETLAEPSSPSVQLDEPPLLIDELMSSPHPDVIPAHGRANAKAKKPKPKTSPAKSVPSSSQPDNSQGKEKERLFDLSSSQIPFPYSQYQNNAPPPVLPNGNGRVGEETTDSEEEPNVLKKKAKLATQYRSLSQLASGAVLYSPDLPTPASKPVMDGKTRKRVAEENSSSSSSSDEDEASGSQHIPQGRRAGSGLEARRKKNLLSRI